MALLQLNAFATIWSTEGFRGFYRGWAANSLKVIPQNAIRFVSYEFLKSLVGVKKSKTDT
jgi:solute carrier family 25 phosphate transporter 23/24/25/41